jgi:flagellar motility protein MotE (MotC chaperone)
MYADNAPMIATFLDRVFRAPNERSLPESELSMRLEDFLYELRESEGENAYPRSAHAYLDEWAHNDRGWLRKFYAPGFDEAYFELTPATETTLRWLDGLFERRFVGTESRLNTAVQLLREIAGGVEENRDLRLAELQRRKSEIDDEIARITGGGTASTLDDRALRERFFEFSRTARELLSDFRAVESNFRELDRNVREQIATWAGEKSEMLERIFGEHDAISESEQGQSFRAFWDFLMDPASQEELSELLDRVFKIDAVADAGEDERLRRIHFDWMSAGEQTQRTVARLSQQLRSYLDDRAYYENRRITEILSHIEQHAIALRDEPPTDLGMELDDVRPDINLPMARPLFSPPVSSELTDEPAVEEAVQIDADALFNRVVVDRRRLLENIEWALRERSQVTLESIVDAHPLEHGLAELIDYFSIAAESNYGYIDETRNTVITWTDAHGVVRRATVPQVVFVSAGNGQQ